ncbi:hypothetical protein F4803DRAFT_574942 [Xylaria telfairii]|nr:hypothetical protein F4803DRAFT_574942 [Xylaria telfairii]
MSVMGSTIFTRPSQSMLGIMSVPQNGLDNQPVKHLGMQENSNSISNDVMLALEVARDSPDAASQGTIRDTLEAALAGIWGRIMADEFGYIMSRDEFAIFNFFQDRFRKNPVATRARKRYWDNLSVPESSPQQN